MTQMFDLNMILYSAEGFIAYKYIPNLPLKGSI